ncbi:hypothetical protein SAMN05421858_3636 [Haladaptatus litoreus]|uniref:Uncharacterized protein n=1 Tax=Haladaptatus litoreus TaxID=553468 RepID=A0A1N7DI45_9EURY|nr:hypothetical protein SAMN05421858_3636 [Haladaptatus litoreus]
MSFLIYILEISVMMIHHAITALHIEKFNYWIGLTTFVTDDSNVVDHLEVRQFDSIRTTMIRERCFRNCNHPVLKMSNCICSLWICVWESSFFNS